MATPIGEELSRYLDLSSAQLKLTATNMANLDTPGYRTKGFDFAAELERSMSAGRREAKALEESVAPRIYLVDGLLERPDGNNVSMDREGLQMADAQLKFRTGVELLKREFARIGDAIHEDK